tara:strand:+ start:373 stop:1149 length:777 start_codon:yes stop_codon:yes gene_type:complete
MLCQYNIESNLNLKKIVTSFKEDWNVESNKVFFFKSNIDISDIKNFYFNLFSDIGKFLPLAEDAEIKDRNKQKNNKIWMEVRFDPSIKNAYRHSASAQPLHTDGSYNPNYPTSTLMCCENNTSEKGETIFIDACKIAKILKNEECDLYDKLKNSSIKHERSGDVRICPVLKKISENKWYVNWNYYCISKNISADEILLKESFQKFLTSNKSVKSNLLELKMNRGDALVWKDNEVLHGRNSFIPKENSSRFIWKCAIDF